MAGTGGELPTRYMMNPIQAQAMPTERRRGGGRKNIPGSYYNNGPRDNRMASSAYRDNRMNNRGSGGSGDGPHNGYRGGGGNELECGPGPVAPPPEGGHRSHHHHASGSHHYNNNQYSHQPHHHHHHHSQHQNKNMEYEGIPSQGRTHSRGGNSNGSHHMDHRGGGGIHQHHQDSHLHGSHQPQTYGSGGGSHHHQPDFVVVQPQQDHHYATGGNVPPVGGHFQAGAPQPIPGPAVGFFQYPNGQPVMGSLVLCHIPYGMNPASVIAPGVQTQIIGCGFMNPTLPYNYACAVPSPLMPTQSVIFQTQSPQQHFIHPQPQFQHVPPPQPPPTSGNDESTVMFDSSAILNPDAHAFFPSMTSFSEEVEEDEEGGAAGDGPTAEIEVLAGSDNELKPGKEESAVSDPTMDKDEVEISNNSGNDNEGSPISNEN